MDPQKSKAVVLPAAPYGPRMPGHEQLAEMRLRLGPEMNVERVKVELVEAAGGSAPNASLDEAVLIKPQLQGAHLGKLHLTDCLVQAGDFTAAHCAETAWLRVRVTGTRFGGTDCSRSLLQDVTFERCKLNLANFRFATLKRVRFVDCDLSDADFQGADLQHVSFVDSLLAKTIFDRVKLKAVDARSSQLIDLRGWESLRGLVVDDLQLAAIAPQLAVAFGLIVEL